MARPKKGPTIFLKAVVYIETPSAKVKTSKAQVFEGLGFRV